MFSSVEFELLAEQLHQFLFAKPGFPPERYGVTQRVAGELALRPACGVAAILGDEGAEALAAIDDPLALELVVSTLDGDEAHLQLLRERPERRQGTPRGEAPGRHLALHRLDDLLIKGPRRRRRNQPQQQFRRRLCHGLLCILSIPSKSTTWRAIGYCKINPLSVD